ncbi:MAG: HNH endonuclease signature motif containing protein [Mycobacterium sp.]
MFESMGESALLAEMSDAQRTERAATARRLLAAGRLCQLRMAGLEEADRTQWCIDNWEAVAAEVGAELGVSRGRASWQMNYGVDLLERLPRLAAVFAAGDIDFRIVAAVAFRTGLITDSDILGRIDAAIALRAGRWNALSRNRITELIDRWVTSLDPAARRTARSAEEDRHVEFGESRDGMVEFWGALRAADAALLERTLDGLADGVCATDPRTKPQRRADALATLAAGPHTMGCECGASDCPAAEAAPAGQVVIHILAEAAALSGGSDATGYLPGSGVVPPAMLREVAKRARLRPLTPSSLLCAESRYRPSEKLADFIRARDLTCRFPGCDKAAEFCDIDHTIPWQQGGPTHPSNLATLCRAHHLLKTFWCGESGWQEKQHPDGRIVWTSPSGRTYTTTPGGALFFPQLAEPTGELNIVVPLTDSPGARTLMMPTRRRSRAEERAARIQWERGLNEARWAADPPPF